MNTHTPRTNAAFDVAKADAEYSYGNPINTQGWSDIACSMRNAARKFERENAELDARVKELEGKCDDWTRLYAEQSARLRAVTEAADSMREELVWLSEEHQESARKAVSDYDAAKSGELPPHPDTARLQKGLRAVAALMAESYGVAGLHQNGDVAPWEDLRSGGRYEGWLLDFDAAMEGGK